MACEGTLGAALPDGGAVGADASPGSDGGLDPASDAGSSPGAEDAGAADGGREEPPGDGGARCDPAAEGTIVDPRDCHPYAVVTIGEQTWLAENLVFETDRGSACYDDDPDHCARYGRLYDWAAALDLDASANAERVRPPSAPRGLCPPGWHIPSSDDWEQLFEAAGGSDEAAPSLRADSELWQQGTSNDDTGFGALPGGYRRGSRFALLGFQAQFQASDETGDESAAFMFLSGISDRARVDDDDRGSDNDKTRFRSVRCLRD